MFPETVPGMILISRALVTHLLPEPVPVCWPGLCMHPTHQKRASPKIIRMKSLGEVVSQRII